MKQLTCETHQVNDKNKKVRTEGKRNRMTFPTRANTVAIAHPHNGLAIAHPHNGLAFPAAKTIGIDAPLQGSPNLEKRKLMCSSRSESLS